MDAFLTNYNNTGPPGIDPSTAKQLPLATATLNRWRRNNADLELPDTLLSCRPSSIKKENDCVPHRPSVSTATGEKKWPRRQAYFALFKVRKKGSQQLGARKKCFPYIWKWKKLVPSHFDPDKHCCSYLEREKSGSLLFGDQKMQFTTVRRKEKHYDIYLKSEKLVHSQQEHETNVSQLFGSEKTGSQLFRDNKHCCSYLEREKSGSLLFGDQKMQFTTVRIKEKIIISI